MSGAWSSRASEKQWNSLPSKAKDRVPASSLNRSSSINKRHWRYLRAHAARAYPKSPHRPDPASPCHARQRLQQTLRVVIPGKKDAIDGDIAHCAVIHAPFSTSAPDGTFFFIAQSRRPSRYTATLARKFGSSSMSWPSSKASRSRIMMSFCSHSASKSPMVKKRTFGVLNH